MLDGAAVGDPSGAWDQLAPAVRADLGHRCGAGRAEGALVGADKRGTLRLEGGPAPFAPGAHLERHWGLTG